MAFAASSAEGETTVSVRDLTTGVTRTVARGDEPSLSADGRTVAYSVPAKTGTSAAGRPYQQVRVSKLGDDGRPGPATTASVDPRGAAADGWSGQPALSGDAGRLAFTTDAVSLGAGGTGPGNLNVVVRDLAAGTSSTANAAAPLSRFDTGTGALSPGGQRLCDLSPPSW